MDQAAFRALLTSSRPTTNAAAAGTGPALGSGSRKRRNDGSLTLTSSSNTADKAASLKPRGQHHGGGKAEVQKRNGDGDNVTKEASKTSEPNYKRFGYVDRAAMRRAGLLEGEIAERPDLATLLGETPVKEPTKTEEEAERELEEEEHRLAEERRLVAESGAKQDTTTDIEEKAPPAKKSRQDKLRELQVKIAAAASQSPEKLSAKPDTLVTALLPKPAFKAIVVRNGPSQGKDIPKGEDLERAAQASEDEDDIFADAGAYHGGLSGGEESMSEEGQAEDATIISTANERNRIDEKLFEDQDTLIPKFEAYRSPTPPIREELEGAQSTSQNAEGGSSRLQRLQGLSDSRSLTAKQLLELDDAAAKEEARKLRKLKGKDRKEAVAKEAELTGKNSQEQKEKDRLNREQQEYEKYERKKAGRA